MKEIGCGRIRGEGIVTGSISISCAKPERTKKLETFKPSWLNHEAMIMMDRLKSREWEGVRDVSMHF